MLFHFELAPPLVQRFALSVLLLRLLSVSIFQCLFFLFLLFKKLIIVLVLSYVVIVDCVSMIID